MMLAPAALSSSVIHASGDAAEGVCKTDLPVPDTPAAQHIAEQYRMKYGTDPAILQFVLLGHDAAQILAALPAGNTTAALSDVAYRSAAGDIINLSSGGAAERLEEVFCVRNETVVRS